MPRREIGQPAICLGGERACPLEDSGGVHGYYEKLAVLRDRGHEDYRDTKTWVGSMARLMGRRAFDPEAFSVAQVNAALRRIR